MTPNPAAKPAFPGGAARVARAAGLPGALRGLLLRGLASLRGLAPCRSRGRAFPLLAAAALAALLAASPAASPARAGDEPFTSPSNYGLTGIYEIPTARVMRKHRYRFGVTEVRPYRYYRGTIGLFDRFEVNGTFNEILGVKSEKTGDNLRDKEIDFKLQIVKEGKYLPAIAIAICDPHGTRVYASQSIVASKQVYPFDFTIGLGNGRLGKRQLPETGEGLKIELFTAPKSWWRDAQLFGGIQYAPADWITLAAEYSPIRYERQYRDFAHDTYFREPVRSKINAGVRLKPFRGAEIDVSWQRGEEIGVGATFAFDIGRPILPIHDPPYREADAARQGALSDRIAAALLATGFSDIGVEADDFSLRIDAENDRYFFTPNAIEAVVDSIAPMVPARYEYVRIRIKENGIPLVEFITTSAAIEGLREGRIPKSRFFEISSYRTEFIGEPIGKTVGRRWYDFSIGPALEGFINDPSSYFSFRAGATAALALFPWKGGSLVLGAETYPFDTVDTNVEPLSIPVRSDSALYKTEDVYLGRLLFEQIVKANLPVYGRAAAGLLETMYAGADAEVAMPLFRGRLIASAGGSVVRKRSPDEPFRMVGNTWYKTAFLGGRLNIPEADIWFDVKGGRFLAGDYGARFSMSKFIRGVTLTAWYTVTDTSIFSDPWNDGYRDKGISATIPIRLFLGRDSRTAYRISLSPWQRDAGQDINRYNTLTDFIGRNTVMLLDKDTRDLYKEVR